MKPIKKWVFSFQYILNKNDLDMAELKGTIKILENKIILKTEGKSETYIKRYSINDSSWIEFKGDIYELELDSEVESEIDSWD